MLYVSRVASNVKGGVDVELGPKTLIVGPNGSGKSAIINSLELALGGFATDLVGRGEVLREIDLMQLATGRGNTLTSVAQLSDGSTAKYEAGGEKKKARHKLPNNIDPKAVFPLSAVREALLGSAATTRKFFVGYTGAGTVTREVILENLGDLRSFYLDAAAVHQGLQLTEEILAVLEFAKKRGNDDARAAKTTKGVALAAGHNLPPEPTDAEILEARMSLGNAKSAFEALVRAAGQAEANAKVRQSYIDSIKSCSESLLKLAEKTDQYEALIPKAQAVLEAVGEVDPLPFDLIPLQKVIELNVDFDACLVCSTPLSDETQVAIAENYQLAEQMLKKHKEHSARYSYAQSEYTKIVNEAKAHLSTIEKVEANLAAYTQKLAALPQATPPEGVDAARAAVDAAENQLRQLESAKAAWASAHKVVDAAVEADVSADSWKKLAARLEAMVARLLNSGVAAFVAKVQEALPAYDVFDLVLRDGDREVCQYGFVREGVLHTALSGSEWVRMTSAIAAACRHGDLNIIVPEDRAWDAVTLSRVLESYNEVPAQIVLATTVRPKAIPAGWTLIER